MTVFRAEMGRSSLLPSSVKVLTACATFSPQTNSVKQEKIGRKHNRIMKMGWHDMGSVHTLCPPLANVNIFVLPLGRRS